MMKPAVLRAPTVKPYRTRLGAMSSANAYYPGGLDLETPVLDLFPGALRDVKNYECATQGGYRRIAGYERVDGQFSPSLASYTIVQVLAFSATPGIGQEVTQAGSGATGLVALVVDNPGEHYLVLTGVVGPFNTSGVISGIVTSYSITQASGPLVVTQASGPFTVPFSTTIGTAIPTTVTISALLDAMYMAAASDVYRALIEPVPGAGNVLGVAGMVFDGASAVYAFRGTENGQEVALYKTTPTGWELVPFFNLIDFTTGDVIEPSDGEVLTQGAVTAVIKRVMTQDGSYGAGDALGQLVITDPVGGNFVAGAATTASGATVILGGAQTPIVLRPGGHFQFERGNFAGQLATRRLYGCDGRNQSFEFDGETLAPIRSPLPVDAPSNIAIHGTYFMISYQASVLFAAPGNPFRWSAIDGGGELAAGDNVTALKVLAPSADTGTMVVYLRNSLRLLYGTSRANFRLSEFPTSTGALAYSAQNMADGLSFDDEAGIVGLSTTLKFGNFQSNAYTKNIARFIRTERTKVQASVICRELSQYRVFFTDGYALYATFVNQTYVGSCVVLYPNPVFCCDKGEDTDGLEPIYFASNDGQGYVYKQDVGSSFDGADIDAFMTPAWDNLKAPRIEKSFRGATVQVDCPSYMAFDFGWRFNYGSTVESQPDFIEYTTDFHPAPTWDSGNWDTFYWDGVTVLPSEVILEGDAENVQVTIHSGTNFIAPYTVSSIIYNVIQRRLMRVG